MRGQKVWLIFSSTGAGRGPTIGAMELHYQGSSPKKLTGTFNDASPAKHYGTIELYRNNSEYQERLGELLNGIDEDKNN